MNRDDAFEYLPLPDNHHLENELTTTGPLVLDGEMIWTLVVTAKTMTTMIMMTMIGDNQEEVE
jgi:hypothetical protein